MEWSYRALFLETVSGQTKRRSAAVKACLFPHRPLTIALSSLQDLPEAEKILFPFSIDSLTVDALTPNWVASSLIGHDYRNPCSFSPLVQGLLMSCHGVRNCALSLLNSSPRSSGGTDVSTSSHGSIQRFMLRFPKCSLLGDETIMADLWIKDMKPDWEVSTKCNMQHVLQHLFEQHEICDTIKHSMSSGHGYMSTRYSERH